MRSKKTEYYVYVYIDPRNFEEFYYGKGKGNRKDAHQNRTDDSVVTKRINEIKKLGLKPIIRVIAKNFTEREALLVEKTLIWKLGKTLDNISTGHFSENFRDHNTMHLELAHFDFKNGLYYTNVGEGEHRCWEDCRKFGFLSAGQHKKWSDPIRSLEPGDIVAAYLKGKGYVGIGRVKRKAVRVNEFKINGKLLLQLDLKVPNIKENSDNEKSEFLVAIDWIKTFDKKDAKKAKRKDGIYSTTHIKASLQGQPKTIEYLEKEFEVDFNKLMLN